MCCCCTKRREFWGTDDDSTARKQSAHSTKYRHTTKDRLKSATEQLNELTQCCCEEIPVTLARERSEQVR